MSKHKLSKLSSCVTKYCKKKNSLSKIKEMIMKHPDEINIGCYCCINNYDCLPMNIIFNNALDNTIINLIKLFLDNGVDLSIIPIDKIKMLCIRLPDTIICEIIKLTFKNKFYWTILYSIYDDQYFNPAVKYILKYMLDSDMKYDYNIFHSLFDMVVDKYNDDDCVELFTKMYTNNYFIKISSKYTINIFYKMIMSNNIYSSQMLNIMLKKIIASKLKVVDPELIFSTLISTIYLSDDVLNKLKIFMIYLNDYQKLSDNFIINTIIKIYDECPDMMIKILEIGFVPEKINLIEKIDSYMIKKIIMSYFNLNKLTIECNNLNKQVHILTESILCHPDAEFAKTLRENFKKLVANECRN